MNSKERIQAILNFEIPDRIGMFDQYWDETLERWRAEGLPGDVGANDYFDTNDIGIILMDPTFQFPKTTLEENDDFIIFTDSDGGTYKQLKNEKSGFFPIEYKIKSRKDWEENKERLCANPTRIENDAKTKIDNYRAQGRFVALKGVCEPYNAVWPKHGTEETMMDMINEPDWMVDMFETHTNLLIETMQMILDMGLSLDGVWAGGDLAYKNGPLFSPKILEKLLLPSYKKIVGFCRDNNLPVLYHTDGDIRQILPLLVDAGISAVEPLEVNAGMDVVELKKTYGDKLVFMGNISVSAMGGSKEDIENEVKHKVLAAKKNGGYIYHSDHSVPPSVSLSNYQHVINMVKKYGYY